MLRNTQTSLRAFAGMWHTSSVFWSSAMVFTGAGGRDLLRHRLASQRQVHEGILPRQVLVWFADQPSWNKFAKELAADITRNGSRDMKWRDPGAKQDKLSLIMDTQPYDRNQCWRLLWSAKKGSNRRLVPVEGCSHEVVDHLFTVTEPEPRGCQVVVPDTAGAPHRIPISRGGARVPAGQVNRGAPVAPAKACPPLKVPLELLRTMVAGLSDQRAAHEPAWFTVCATIARVAVSNGYTDQGRVIWHEFSSRCPAKYSAEDADSKYSRLASEVRLELFGETLRPLMQMLQADNPHLLSKLRKGKLYQPVFAAQCTNEVQRKITKLYHPNLARPRRGRWSLELRNTPYVGSYSLEQHAAVIISSPTGSGEHFSSSLQVQARITVELSLKPSVHHCSLNFWK